MDRHRRNLLAALALMVASTPVAWASHGADDVVAATIDATVTSTVEDTVTATVEATVTSTVEDTVTSTVEATVTSTVEDTVTSAVEDTVTGSVEDSVTGSVEDSVTTSVEGSVTATVEDSVTSSVEDSVQGSVEQEAQDSVEGSVESAAESSAESSIDDSVESAAEQQTEVETEVEHGIETEVESGSPDDTAADTGVDDHGGERIDNSGPGNADDETPSPAESESGSSDNSGPGNADDDASTLAESRSGSSGSSGSGSATAVATANTATAATAATGASSGAGSATPERFAGVGLDRDGNEISIGEWLVIATAGEIATLERLGYVTRSREPLDGLGRVLARMQAPDSFDIAATQAAIHRAVPDAEVDFNHVYRTGSDDAAVAAPGARPRDLFPAAALDRATPTAIGMIDTRVATAHPALRAARIHAQDFVSYDATRPDAHGTSVASILVGGEDDCRGLLPAAELYAASVFFTTPTGGDTATTVSLVRALDWMTRNRVPVVNMSLAGPANGILQVAIDQAAAQGTVVVAAVGNRGPAAKPLYPAAYPEVVAVTAVTAAHSVYRLANRGAHVDFAAPGVNVLHADARGGYVASSGTSMAAPFVTAVIAASCGGDRAFTACLRDLQAGAQDIGAAGFDPVYGFGFIVPVPRIDRTASN